MTRAAAVSKRAKGRRQPVYLALREMMDPETGELRKAFVAADPREREVLRARKYKLGQVLRADIHKPRNPKFHRLVFAALQIVLDSQEGLQTIEQLLTVIKIKLGRVETLVDPVNGKAFYVPESIAFDSMDEVAFQDFWRDLCRVISRDYIPGMTPEQLEEMASIMDGTPG